MKTYWCSSLSKSQKLTSGIVIVQLKRWGNNAYFCLYQYWVFTEMILHLTISL